ncbi:rho GTPase-activating protein 7 isoform X2 [Belonocnema kinseyi]|uniref:rho GTPase-activating protein 7 isoform X2 n=1 Tax=Belonocnema kinseyi TaxID=2817044 RepID=UPI00143DC391|nr:rho GTPase-activating protein 7 isoform X2 [Belonocnema kinseyi]
METVRENGVHRVNGSTGSEVSGSPSKSANRLKIVESGVNSEKFPDESSKEEMDPYKELELYLAKVNEEISEIIESVPPSRLINTQDPKCPPNSETKTFHSPTPMTRDRSCGTNSLPSRSNSLRQASSKTTSNAPGKDDISDWSENILAEFNNIIAKEINELTRAKLKANRVEYKDLLNEFGISDSSSSHSLEELPNGIDSSRPDRKLDRKPTRIKRNQTTQNIIQDEKTSNDHSNSFNHSNSDSKDRLVIQNRRLSGSLPENLQDVDGRGRRFRQELLNSDWVAPSEISMDPSGNSLRLNRNSSSLPTDFDSKDVSIFPGSSNEPKKEKLREENGLDTEVSSTSNGGPWSGFKLKNLENLRAKLPPRQSQESRRKTSISSKGVNHKRRRINYERIKRSKEHDSDCEERNNLHEPAHRSKSLENYSPRSAPVTPTEEKIMPFSRFLRKKHTPIYHENGKGAVLVRVSSLPDQDLLHLSNEQLSKSGKKGGSQDESVRKRDLFPLTLKSDLTAKRLSESNKDVGRVSPMNLKKFPFRRSKSNDVAVECHFPVVEKGENSQNGIRKEGRIEDESDKRMDEDSPKGSYAISLNFLLSRFRNGSGTCCTSSPPTESLACADIATQTSPTISRSSSFTWVSDYESLRAGFRVDVQSFQDEATLDQASPQDTVDDDNRSSSSSQDLLQSMDEISSGSVSPDTTDRASPLESGIGTASPPRSTERRSIKRLSITASSSLSSGELLESPPRAPSSPSAASLQLKSEPLAIELGGKSSSAPLLENNDVERHEQQEPVLQQPRSQSERQLSEIEAQEACKWLRAAGFPQYAQMYEDYQFPIDVSGVSKDHPFLETDSLHSLFRRLHALNRCANMKLDTHHTHHQHHNISHSKNGGGEDSDEDNQCALSENWTFENKTRRWSRVCDVNQSTLEKLQTIAGQNLHSEEESLEERIEAEEADDQMVDSFRYASLPPGTMSDELGQRFRRTGSERLRDGAKAFLRRVESLKSRRRKRQNRDGVVISGPQVLDVISMQQKMKDLNCVDVSPTGQAPLSFNDLPPPTPFPMPSSPLTLPASAYHYPSSPTTNAPSPLGDDSSSYCSDGSQCGGPTPTPTRTKLNRAKRFLHRGREDQGTLSDSECQPTSWRQRYFKDANSNHTKVLEYVSQSPKDALSKPGTLTHRGGSLNLGKESKRRDNSQNEDKVSALKREEKFHKSFRHGREDVYREERSSAKEVTIYREKSRSKNSELAGSQESSSTAASRDSDQEEDSPRHKGNVVRWHSFQRGSLNPDALDPLCPRAMASMSCGQLLVLRKLALLKLTACMERYCPTHRTGWNWELPKFIRKIKSPDYKDKTVFGVPLLVSLQRTGQALPKCIQIALKWLRVNALDQVGLFRKSGAKSRISKLKDMTESHGENINFDGQQAYDVADLVKQYFRELPEALLTNKLSETFIAIFQHVPLELRPDAVQCVLLLLPDEHREALEFLLDFLNQVANNSHFNQMTPSNLGVCLAPSLFHFSHNPNVTNRSNSVSPRRRKTGIPDQRELSENKAAQDCLMYLVKCHRELFMVSTDMLTQCRFNYMEESIPVGLEELGSELNNGWRGYLHACTSALLKEAREKSRGWVTVNNPAESSVEMAYKKVGDGHPLRLWRVSTDVEAPPNELLRRVLRERDIWDHQLLKYKVISKLDLNVEVFQYATGNMSPPLPVRDYCVLRSWRNDLPKDACVIVETSVEHPDAPIMIGGTRGIVLASRYLIEPCGSGKSRIMHLSRVDTKGRTPEWYNKTYGHIAALHLSKIRNSFKHTTDGPESKV